MKGGRYGPYVTAGGVNATIPAEFEKDAVTLAQAIALIDERAAKGGGKPKKARQAGEEGEGSQSRRWRGRRAKTQETGREESRGQNQIRIHQQGARSRVVDGQDFGRQGVGDQGGCRQSSGQEECRHDLRG